MAGFCVCFVPLLMYSFPIPFDEGVERDFG